VGTYKSRLKIINITDPTEALFDGRDDCVPFDIIADRIAVVSKQNAKAYLFNAPYICTPRGREYILPGDKIGITHGQKFVVREECLTRDWLPVGEDGWHYFFTQGLPKFYKNDKKMGEL